MIASQETPVIRARKSQKKKERKKKKWSMDQPCLAFFSPRATFLISLLHPSATLSQDAERDREKKRTIHQWDLMLPHPARRSYHMVYIINNLYEPVSWLKHKGNVLLLPAHTTNSQPQASWNLFSVSISPHLIASQHKKKKKKRGHWGFNRPLWL